MITLEQTNSAGIAAALLQARRHAGSPAMGMVLTLVIVVEEEYADIALDEARQASREHPARVLAVVLGDKRGHGTVNASVGIGSGWGGETALIKLTGEVAKHPESVVLPLLLPDSPVVVWWPHDAPADPSTDALGRLGQRRITDSATGSRQRARLTAHCAAHAPGDTDLAWTRLTPWRALLAAALDQHPLEVTGASVSADRGNPSADLLAAWLEDRLRVSVVRHTSGGPGLTEVTLDTVAGPIRISRPDGRLATFSTPNRPDRPIALRRREVPELLAEELQRLDEDDVYAATAKRLAGASARPAARKTAVKTATKKTATTRKRTAR